MSSNPFRVVLVEDDNFQTDDFTRDLKASLPSVEIETLSCEAEFLDRYEKRPEQLPDLFVLDLMLEWRNAYANTTRPLPVPAPYLDEAGLRCLAVIRKYSPRTPVIIWTMTNKEVPLGTVDERITYYFCKDQALEGDFSQLVKKIFVRENSTTI